MDEGTSDDRETQNRESSSHSVNGASPDVSASRVDDGEESPYSPSNNLAIDGMPPLLGLSMVLCYITLKILCDVIMIDYNCYLLLLLWEDIGFYQSN